MHLSCRYRPQNILIQVEFYALLKELYLHYVAQIVPVNFLYSRCIDFHPIRLSINIHRRSSWLKIYGHFTGYTLRLL